MRIICVLIHRNNKLERLRRSLRGLTMWVPRVVVPVLYVHDVMLGATCHRSDRTNAKASS